MVMISTRACSGSPLGDSLRYATRLLPARMVGGLPRGRVLSIVWPFSSYTVTSPLPQYSR